MEKKRGAVKRKKTKYSGIYKVMRFDSESGTYVECVRGKKYTATKSLFVDAKRKQIEKSFETLQEALDWRRYGSDSQTSLNQETISFGALVEKYLQHKKNRVRASTYKKDSAFTKHIRMLYKIPISQFTFREIDQWLNRVKQTDYLSTQHKTRQSYFREVGFIGCVFAYAKDYIDPSIISPVLKRHKTDSIVDAKKFKVKKQSNSNRYLSNSEREAFEASLDVLASDDIRLKSLALMAKLQLRTGLRVSEAAAIEWKDLSTKNEMAVLNVSKSVEYVRQRGLTPQVVQATKTYETRLLPFCRDFYQALKEFQLLTGRREGLVFSEDGKTPYTYRQIQHFYDRAFEAAGIEMRGTHLLRHTFATLFIEKTGNQVALKGILGHSSIKQTDHYAKVTLEGMLSAAQKFGESLSSNRAVNGK